MTSKITVWDSVDVRGTQRLIEYIISQESIKVQLRDEDVKHDCIDAMNPYDGSAHVDELVIPWNKLDDVEFLASLFEFETVKVFKAIVEQLGKLHAAQELYRALA